MISVVVILNSLSLQVIMNQQKSTLCYVLTAIMKLLHPFMPFVTEEIYSMLPIKDSDSIMISTYPEYDSNLVFKKETAKVDEKVSFIAAFRNIKAENGIGKDALVKINNKDNIILKMLKIEDSLTEDELTINSYNVKSGEIEATIIIEKIVTEERKSFKRKTNS